MELRYPVEFFHDLDLFFAGCVVRYVDDICARDVFKFDVRTHNPTAPRVFEKREVLP